jgi:hypothetical protein
MPNQTWSLLTPSNKGAIAVIQIPAHCLKQLTSRTKWDFGTLYLVDIPNIDEAVAVKINEETAHIMPHGGLHILRKLEACLAVMGIEQSHAPKYLEAEDEIEARMLEMLAFAESPLAVELLLAQPSKLRGKTPTEDDLERASILNHLIHPPKVVLLGAPNTGKSTLMNALTKQDTSIVHDLPGATRDAVGARINCFGLVLDLYDLPGFRESDDPIEQEAISLAQQISADAVLTILTATASLPWEKLTLSQLNICSMSDIKGRDDADLCVSAHTGENMEKLATMIRDAIVPPKILLDDRPWFFPGSYSPTDE